MKLLVSILFILGLVLLVSANILGVGYGLYLWGSVGVPIGVAVWGGFKVWIITLQISITSIFIGYVGSK